MPQTGSIDTAGLLSDAPPQQPEPCPEEFEPDEPGLVWLLSEAMRRLHCFCGALAGWFRLQADTPTGYIAAMRNELKTSVRKRLSRIEGQVRGLAKMVEEDRYCIDIITQIAAVRAALRRAEDEILKDHVAHCVEHAVASGDRADQRDKIAELVALIGRVER